MGFKPIESGTVFGKLTVIEPAEPFRNSQGNLQSTSLCRCECGTVSVCTNNSIKSGHKQSCGCLYEPHGMAGTPEHTSWRKMRERCEKPRCDKYYRYGGRGISVCERWKEFANFIADMGRKPSPTHSLDRIDPNGNYCPENCRWASREEQHGNKVSSIRLTFYGMTKAMSQWAKISLVDRRVISLRLKKGWSPKAAVWTPGGGINA